MIMAIITLMLHLHKGGENYAKGLEENLEEISQTIDFVNC